MALSSSLLLSDKKVKGFGLFVFVPKSFFFFPPCFSSVCNTFQILCSQVWVEDSEEAGYLEGLEVFKNLDYRSKRVSEFVFFAYLNCPRGKSSASTHVTHFLDIEVSFLISSSL